MPDEQFNHGFPRLDCGHWISSIPLSIHFPHYTIDTMPKDTTKAESQTGESPLFNNSKSAARQIPYNNGKQRLIAVED
jgi:hypothetical protein